MNNEYSRFVGSAVKVEGQQATGEVLEKIKKLAEDNDHKVRVMMPGGVGTCDFVPERLNVGLDKDADDIWRVVSVSFG